MGKGNKSAQSGKQTIVNELPDYARPYFTNIMKRAEADSLNQYQPYGGQRIAESGSIAASVSELFMQYNSPNNSAKFNSR